MSHTLKIPLAQRISSHLAYRNSVAHLIADLEKADKYVFDFSGVVSISHSFVDQIYRAKTRFESHNIAVEFVNIPEEWKAIFEFAAHPKHRVNASEEELNIRPYTTREDLVAYMSSF